ncbi:sensor domain-containing diguanylate cyclase [Thalassotalea sediminis]|uniref:sensor domain-containing diguanylate cyclase n=1 Tax=Thalassotalea sediminis TaxID=1759089 RepID=UPI0025738CE1|nr:diguanylate cyclase [Thalassotalea sediminis]
MRLAFCIVMAISYLLMFNTSHATASATFGNKQLYNSTTKIEFFKLSAQKQALTINQIQKTKASQWLQLSSNNVNVAEGNNWLKVVLTNTLDKTVDTHLVIDGRQFLYQFIFYQVNMGTKDLSSPLLLSNTRQLNNVVTTQITLHKSEQKVLYIKLSSLADRVVQIRALNQYRFTDYISEDNFISGIAIGGLSAMVLILLFVFLSTFNHAILLLAAYLAALAGNLAAMYGVNFSILFPHYPEIHGKALPLFTTLGAVFILWFCSELFKLATQSRYLYWSFHLIGWSLLAYAGISFFLSFNENIFISNIIQIVTALFLVALAIHLARCKHQLAPLFAAFVVVQGFIVAINIGFYDGYHFNTQIYTAGYWVTGLLIVFILGRQSSYEKYEKNAARQQALESAIQSKQAQDELLSLQNENQEQLELAVQERTLELNIALQELEEANRELEQKNTQDELTGLFNRRYYDQKLLAEFRRSRRNLTPLSMIVIDIDHFKSINDKYGHTAGDVCLVTLAQLIKQTLRRSSDVGCRYGGEEFCLILPETDAKGAISLAEEIREKVMTTAFSIEGQQLSLTVSCGLTTYQQQAEVSPVDIFNTADQALYLAKVQGRNQVVVKAMVSNATNAD